MPFVFLRLCVIVVVRRVFNVISENSIFAASTKGIWLKSKTVPAAVSLFGVMLIWPLIHHKRFGKAHNQASQKTC